jgi:hypothetical protein
MIDGMFDLWPQLNERSEAQTWHDGFAVRRNLFRSNDLVARLQVSAHDLGKIIVLDSGSNGMDTGCSLRRTQICA